MRQSKDDTVTLLKLALQLRKAASRARRTDPALARRLAARFEKAMRQVRVLEAGRTSEPRSYMLDGNLGFGAAERGAILNRMGIDLRAVTWTMAGRNRSIFA